MTHLSNFFILFNILVLTSLLTSACTTIEQKKEDEIYLVKLDEQEYQPITRLALVKDKYQNENIILVRADPSYVVSAVETAAGQSKEDVEEH